ncbi:hypothetical protein SAMN04487905_108225 [Actinopolyspora xinjiangensis]|uniref:Excreted virulence factor EspC, type VII ESX diderm n=1 Tax=Actinopolyspora xinjiangensis TaxID=405564 RepID=A0A1H0VE63_9ACTN|nr:hypothetical protein [Actinopolyspora xinjiangensis]SDP76822.1 hypothetical protein SAMN04487905_108225 [Actinopolyspora xinjiangensis]
MSQDGFSVDHDKLKAAVEDLRQAREEAAELAESSTTIGPGELTAYDDTTGKAREAFQKRMSDPEGSLRAAAVDIRDKLDEKIAAYEALLREYGLADDNASLAQRDSERRS